MASMLVTCPESAHLEKIEYEQGPLGMLIDSCSAFAGCPLTCPRTCAARLDRKHGKHLVGTTLVVRSCLRRK